MRHDGVLRRHGLKEDGRYFSVVIFMDGTHLVEGSDPSELVKSAAADIAKHFKAKYGNG